MGLEAGPQAVEVAMQRRLEQGALPPGPRMPAGGGTARQRRLSGASRATIAACSIAKMPCLAGEGAEGRLSEASERRVEGLQAPDCAPDCAPIAASSICLCSSGAARAFMRQLVVEWSAPPPRQQEELAQAL